MGAILNVLLAEDRPADVKLILHALRRDGFDVVAHCVETEADFLAHLRPELDIILSDYSMQQFDAERGPLGANLVGTPDEVAAKIIYEHDLFGLDRFLIQMSVGTLPHEKVLRSIELFGTKVAPIVRREIERRTPAIPMPAGERGLTT